MKIIIYILFLSILLTSCGKQVDNISFKGTSIVQTGNIDINSEKKQEVKVNNNLDKKLKEQEINRKLTEREKILDKTFEHYSNLSLNSKVNLNCEELNPVREGMSKKEKDLALLTTSKCNNIRNQARDNLSKVKSGFIISDCKKNIEEKEKKFEEFNKNQNLSNGFIGSSKEERKKLVEYEIEVCEIGYALDENNCELIKDETRKQKCIKLKKDTFFLKQVLNFKKEDYIR